jgi:inner membrane protein
VHVPDIPPRLLVIGPCLCLVIVVACDRMLRAQLSLPVGGTLDATGHFATGAIVACAAWALNVRLPWFWVLVGSVVVDVDHFLVWFDVIDRFDSTSRGVLHTLASVWLVLALAACLPRYRDALVALAVGIASHLFRDLGTGTVQIAWPVLDTLRAISHRGYLLALASLAAIPVLAGLRDMVDNLRDTQSG